MEFPGTRRMAVLAGMDSSPGQQHSGGTGREVSTRSLEQGSLERSLPLPAGPARLLADSQGVVSARPHLGAVEVDSLGLRRGGFLNHFHKPASHIQLVSQLGIKPLSSKPSRSPVLMCAPHYPKPQFLQLYLGIGGQGQCLCFPCPSASKQHQHSLSPPPGPHPGARNTKEIPEDLPFPVCCSFHIK